MQQAKHHLDAHTCLPIYELAAIFARSIRANYAPGDWQIECLRMIDELEAMADARRGDAAVAHSQSQANLASKDAAVLEALAESLHGHFRELDHR